MEVSSVVRDCLHPHISTIIIALVQVIMDLTHHHLPHLITIDPLRILHHHTNKSCGSITSSSNIIINRVPQDPVQSVYQVRNILMSPCRNTPESVLIAAMTGRDGTDTIILTITTIPSKTNAHEGIME